MAGWEESQMTPILLASMEIKEEPEVARQGAYGQPCGVHTILNGWAYCMGLNKRINKQFKMPEDVFNSAIELIELALAGHCDFWLIYWWMETFQFIKPLVQPPGFPQTSQQISLAHGNRPKRVLEHADLVLGGHHLWVHSRLIENGARFFDQTIRFDSNDDLDRMANQALDKENEEWALVQERATIHSEVFPRSSPGTHQHQSMSEDKISTKAMKEQIRSLVMDQFQNVNKNSDFDDATMAILTRACSHLAWFVRQRLNGGTVSGREVSANKTFEQLAIELLGRNFHLSAIFMHAVATVVHGLLDGDPALPTDVLRECMRSMEEGRYPDREDDERIKAAKAAVNTMTSGDDDDDDNGGAPATKGPLGEIEQMDEESRWEEALRDSNFLDGQLLVGHSIVLMDKTGDNKHGITLKSAVTKVKEMGIKKALSKEK